MGWGLAIPPCKTARTCMVRTTQGRPGSREQRASTLQRGSTVSGPLRSAQTQLDNILGNKYYGPEIDKIQSLSSDVHALGGAMTNMQDTMKGIKKLNSFVSANSAHWRLDERMAHQFVDNADLDPTRVGDEFVEPTGIFKGTIVKDLPASYGWDPVTSARTGTIDRSSIVVFPTITNALWMSPQTTVSTPFVDVVLDCNDHVTAGSQKTDVPMIFAGNNDHRILLPNPNALGDFVYELGFTWLTGTDLFTVTTRAIADVLMTFWQAGNPFTVALVCYPFTPLNVTGAAINAAGVTGLSVDYVSFQIDWRSTPASDDRRVVLSPTGNFSFNVNGQGANTYASYSFEDLMDIGTATHYRCVSLNVLQTYMGSSLDNGGQIASARLHPGLYANIPGKTHYDFLASRPHSSYDGPLKLGSYMWWLPSNKTEMFFRRYREGSTLNLSNLTTLQSYAIRDDPAQGVRLKITAVFEVHVNSPLYETKLATYSPTFYHMVHFLRTLPAATENPNHKDLLKRLWGSVRKKGSELASDPDNWMKLAKMIGPVVASII